MHKGTILIIDDEKDLIELVRYNLDKEGYDVISASDGKSRWRLDSVNMNRNPNWRLREGSSRRESGG